MFVQIIHEIFTTNVPWRNWIRIKRPRDNLNHTRRSRNNFSPQNQNTTTRGSIEKIFVWVIRWIRTWFLFRYSEEFLNWSVGESWVVCTGDVHTLGKKYNKITPCHGKSNQHQAEQLIMENAWWWVFFYIPTFFSWTKTRLR